MPEEILYDMNNHHNPDLFYDHAASRSPGSHRHQQPTLHRQPSRQFDAYGQIALPQYVSEDQNQRYDTTRFDRMNNVHNGNYGFDPQMSQTWNASSFGANPAFNFGATGRMKPNNRGRSNIPSVRPSQLHTLGKLVFLIVATELA